MPNTFELIASSTVGAGGTAAIDFTSIPSTYTDLCLKMSLRGNQAGNSQGTLIKFNGSSTGYSGKLLEGDGATAASGNGGTASINSLIINATSSTASTFTNTELYLTNYSGSNNKSLSLDTALENNATTAYLDMAALLWSNSAAINQITVTIGAGLFAQYSTAYLYGVKNA